jgi:KDO2-lipid IV(A) lauroyltransferase
MGTDAIIDPRTMPSELHSVKGVTQWYTQQLERTIRQAPQQYWWIHRRWRDYKTKPKAMDPAASKAA